MKTASTNHKGREISNLVGRVFGKLTVTNVERNGRGRVAWRCVCSCGRVVVRETGGVKRSKSCGCDRYTTDPHKLTNVSEVERTAKCSVCGPVKVYFHKVKTSSRWRCATQTKGSLTKHYHANYYHKHKEALKLSGRERQLWVKYRITLNEQKQIELFQSAHPAYKLLLGNRLGTDHCHKTGLIRGRLEWRINRAYGLLERVAPEHLPEVLRALAEYHEHPPAELALGSKRYGLIGQAKNKKNMVYGPPHASHERSL